MHTFFVHFIIVPAYEAMSDSVKETKEEQNAPVVQEEKPVEVAEETKVESTSTEVPAVDKPSDTTSVAEKPADAPAEATPASVTEEPSKPAEDVVQETPVAETVEKVVDQFENMTIFGNKSLDELHKIQSKRSHLSAGILFTDPALKM